MRTSEHTEQYRSTLHNHHRRLSGTDPWRWHAPMRSALIIISTVTALLSSACSSADSPHGRSNPRGLAHIHGMGVDSDGVLYAGTHYGVYRLAGERDPELVGDLVQDFMGFTVVGPNHFLGSGHPGADSRDAPPNLGLIESTDGGQTWHSLSMTGEADFHSLDYRHGLLFGLDSGTRSVMVTADKKTWERRAKISAVDIAVSPTEPNGVLATTGTGMLRSIDQAKTFHLSPAHPSDLAELARRRTLNRDYPDRDRVCQPRFGGDVAGAARSG